MTMAISPDLFLILRFILRSINDSIPNQVSTARNFPAFSLARPEPILRAIHLSLAPPSLKAPQYASHAQKDCGERTRTNIPEKPRKKEANGPAATSRSVAASHICTTKDGETRKATVNRLAVMHSSRLLRQSKAESKAERKI
jgi:hypothetical protein